MVAEPVMVVKVLSPEVMVASRGEVVTGEPVTVTEPVVVSMTEESEVIVPTRGRTVTSVPLGPVDVALAASGPGVEEEVNTAMAPELEAEAALDVADALVRYSVEEMLTKRSLVMDESRHTLTELDAIADDTGSILSVTGGVGAVPDAVTKVDVAAEAGKVTRRAAERLSLTQHVVDTDLLCDKRQYNVARWERFSTSTVTSTRQTTETYTTLGERAQILSGNERGGAKGEDDRVLHLWKKSGL